MGVKTSSEIFARKKDEEIGKVYSGGKRKETKFVNSDNLSFAFPTPIHGTSFVFLPIDGERTKLTLSDGIFSIPKSWKVGKKEAYKKALLKAKFVQVEIDATTNKKKEEAPKSYIYFAGHPDNKDTEKVSGNTSIEIDGKKIELEILDGVITTEDKQVYDVLLKKGYYEAKQPQEIKE